MDFQLTTEQALLKDRARAFARQMIAPKAADYDREARFPWELLRAAQQQGLLHLTIPPTYGGMGSSVFEQALVVEELAWACTGITAAINLNSLAISALLLAGTTTQKRHYLPRLLAGELCSFALTEPVTGSDPGAIQTTALRTEHGTGESYLLNGRKTWISNAPEATLLIIFAKTSPTEGANGISAFLIERSTPGVLIGPPLGKLGQRATPTAEIVLQDVQVPRDALLGSQDYGFGLAMQVFDRSRPLVAAYGVGLAQRCLDEALAHARTRKTMGKPIIEHQAIGTKIAEMGMRLEAARLLTCQACWLLDTGQSATLQVAYAKAFAADTSMWAASEAVQIFGGAGYGTDLPLEKLFRDAKALQIYEGTSEIQRLIMVSELARTPLSSTIRPEPVQQDSNTTDTSMVFARILPDDESTHRSQEVATTDASHPPVHELFEAQVERTPDRVALICTDEQLTYAALNQRANQLAPRLQELGVGPDVLVGICIERSVELIIALLGVLKAGGTYVFLDPTYPTERLLFMQQDAQVNLLLTQQRLLARVPHQQVPIFCLDTAWEALEQESSDSTKSRAMQQQLAYLIYTSGSTGLPKAVMIEQAGLSNMLEEQIRLFGISSEHRIAHFAPFNFDASISELFLALLSGAPLFLLSQDQRWPIAPLLHSLREYAITTITLPPSVLSLLPPEQLPALQTIISAGEDLSREVADRWLSGRNVFNAYGPTEITVCATLGRCQQDMGHPSIGFPLAHTRIYLLDALLQPVKRGETGEIFIGGIGVARGYLGRPDLTAARFLPDPFSTGTGQQRLYRTGDLARFLPDGSLEYLGRVDHQVKIHGQRIELGEIEAALARHPAIRECVVLGREVGEDGKRLLAYIVKHNGTQAAPSSQDLRAFLQYTLPDAMIPAAFVLVNHLPLTPNGKLDRQALLAQALPSFVDDEKTDAPPYTSLEEQLATMLAKLLGIPRVGKHTRFIDLGSDSLLLARLLARVQETFQVTLTPRSVYDFPTVATLAQQIARAQQDTGKLPAMPLRSLARDGTLPLSFSQQRLWFLDQLAPGSASYTICQAFRFSGRFHIDAFRRSLQEMVRRHEILRTAFADGDETPIQVIAPAFALSVPLITLDHLPAAEQEAEIQRLVREEEQRSFDLSKLPLLRCTLMRVQQHEHVFLVSIHHTIADGWSMGIFYQELEALYQAFVEGRPSPLPDLPLHYADFAQWQRQGVYRREVERQLLYWQQHLAGATTVLELPTDYPRPPIQSDRGAQLTFTFPLELTQQLKELSQREEVTLFMILLAALSVLLGRYSGQEDLLIGSPIANRPYQELEPMIGFLANTLVLRTTLTGQPTFRELLGRVRETCLAAYEHQDVPFEQLVEHLQLQRDLSRSPLVQVVFALQQASMYDFALTDLEVSPLPIAGSTTKFDLLLDMVETPEGLRGKLEYSQDLFDKERMLRLLGHWQTILAAIVRAPHSSIGQLPLLTEAEKQQRRNWNQTEIEYPATSTIHQLFARQVARMPDAIALVFEDQQLSYAALDRRANQLAHYLRSLGVGPETLVGLCFERSFELMIALLAIFKAGGAYVPLDPSYPTERLAFMLKDAQVELVLTHSRWRAVLPSVQAGRLLCVDEVKPLLHQENTPPQNPLLHPLQLAYVIYTSGSTGQPKAAMNSHLGLLNRLLWMQQTYALGPGDVVLQKTPISFDVSVWELLWSLIVGAGMVLARPGGHRDPDYLHQLIEQQQVSVVHFVPSMLQAFLMSQRRLSSPHLRHLICSGEALSLELQQQAVRQLPAQVHNLYGPTEAAIDVTAWPCREEQDQRSVPIGRPIANIQIHLLDERLQPVPVGVRGELYIGGVGVGRGYLGRAELTAERFVPDPFSQRPGTRLYRTGDLASYREDGAIEYLGRIDHQVKLRGFRIELGEIETALLEHPAVQESVVDFRTSQAGDQRLLAYIVPDLNYQPVETLANELANEYIAQWQMLYEQTYRTASTLPDPTFNLVGWNSSYTGQPLAPTEMSEQIDQTVERILALHPTSVLEIGCGTGLLLFRIAPFCSSYRGSDFSSEALHYVEQFLPDLQLSQVTLDQRLAHDFSGMAEKSFDVIILNSLIQYFPDIDYFFQTLTGTLRMLKPGGSIFIGDIRSYPLFKAYAASVEFFQAASSCTKEELRQRVRLRTSGEEELLIDPQFFMDLHEHLPQIAHLQIQLRRGHAHNELTRFRYDVILTMGMAQEEQRNLEVVYWHQQTHTIHSLGRLLQETDADVVQLKHVPNTRLMTEARVLSWLNSENGPTTVAALKDTLRESDEIGIDPEELWSLGDRLGYITSVSWSETGRVADCDVLFERTPATVLASQRGVVIESNQPFLRSWKSYANNPLQGKVTRKIIPQLREYLTERLPEYMVPAAFISVEQLPLTPNGKVDRRALPDPDATRSATNEAFVPPRNPIEELLASIWCDLLDLKRVGIHENFFALGGHSLLAIQLMFRVNQNFQVDLLLQSVFEHPTLAEFAEALLAHETVPGKLTRIAQLRLKILAMSASERLSLLASKRKKTVK
jgi:amino acid adenylation domain-containing protein